jgi:hypothetical protein
MRNLLFASIITFVYVFFKVLGYNYFDVLIVMMLGLIVFTMNDC